LTRGEGEDDLLRTQDLRPIEKVSEYSGNLENSILKSFSEAEWNTTYREVFEKTIRENINGLLIEKVILKNSKSSDKTVGVLMKLISSLFMKDAVLAKNVLGKYIIILKENEILKNERRNIFSEARFRARIMLIISALLMGFLSAIGPVISLFSSFKPSFQPELSQAFPYSYI